MPKTPTQRFCSPACRAAYSRRRQLEGIPGRLGAGPRRLKSGAWSITVHLDEMPNAGPGSELRVKVLKA